MRWIAYILLLICVAGVDAGNRILVIRHETTYQFMQGKPEPEDTLSPMAVPFPREVLTTGYYQVSQGPERLLRGDLSQYDMLLLPGVICLDSMELRGVWKFLNRGGGVFATGPIGVRDGQMGWRGFTDLNNLVGAEVTEVKGVEVGKVASFQLKYGSPGTNAVAPGFYLRFTPFNVPYAAPGARSWEVAGYYAKDGYEECDPSTIKRDPGFIVRGLPSGGRFAWMGVNIESMHLDSANQEGYGPLFKQLFGWLMGEAAMSIEPWPKGYKSAVLIHGDIEDKFENVVNIVRVFQRYKVSTTYNLLTESGKQFPEVMKELASDNAELGIHGDNHKLFGGVPLELQVQRLRRAMDYVDGISERPVGFRPPELDHDSNTVKAVKMLGMEYLMADRMPDRDYPRFTPNRPGSDDGLVTFPKGELDDYDLFERFKIASPSQMAQMMIQDFERIDDLRGLYQLNYHSQMLSKPEFVMVVESALKVITGRTDLWIAPTRDVTQWMKKRIGLKVTTITTDSTIRLTVSNDGYRAVSDAVLRVHPPHTLPVDKIFVSEISKSCTYDILDSVFFLNLPKLNPHEIFTAQLEYGKTGIYKKETRTAVFWALRLGLLGLSLFLLGAVYYFFFSKRSLVASAEGQKTLDSMETGIYGPPSAPRSTISKPPQHSEPVRRTEEILENGLLPSQQKAAPQSGMRSTVNAYIPKSSTYTRSTAMSPEAAIAVAKRYASGNTASPPTLGNAPQRHAGSGKQRTGTHPMMRISGETSDDARTSTPNYPELDTPASLAEDDWK